MRQPVIVFPFHDTDGLMFSHLEAITPQLKETFGKAFVSVSPLTAQAQSERINRLREDSFFQLNFNRPDTFVGDHFLAGYKNAAASCSATQSLHLCTIDRVAFALQTEHRDQFLDDVKTAGDDGVPLLFQRSAAAWSSHPKNYQEIEGLATKAGEILFGRRLDFIWCHLVIPAQHLRDILPDVKSHDLGMLAEIVLRLRDVVKTRDVDWLGWEDPFILSCDPVRLKHERESSPQETRKRLASVLSVLQILLDSVSGDIS